MPKIKTSERQRRLADLQRKMPDIKDEYGVRRFIALLFGFCSRCENDACRRAKNCLGEAAPCVDAFWPAVPEIEKDMFREMIKARVAGAKTPQEIADRAMAAMMRHYQTVERLAAAQSTAPAVAQEKPPEPVLPRIRVW